VEPECFVNYYQKFGSKVPHVPHLVY